MITKCSYCGSKDVATKMWVSINTQKIIDLCSDGEDDDNWCNNCQTHCRTITEESQEEINTTDITINIVEAASDLAHFAMCDELKISIDDDGEVWEEDPDDVEDLHYKPENQEIFDRWYDFYYDYLLNKNITKNE